MTSSSPSVSSKTNARFLIVPHLFPDETLTGYLLRLAEDNGYAGNKQICAALGLPIESLDGCGPTLGPSEVDLSSVAQATGLQENKLQQSCFHRSPCQQCATFAGISYPIQYIKFKYPKFCAACLAESPYHRWYWDLAHMTVCIKHKLKLIDKCPSCKKRISWDRHSLTSCACGCSWTEVEEQTITDPAELWISQRVLMLIGQGVERSDQDCLTALGLADLLDVTFFAAELYLLATKSWTLKLRKQNQVFHIGLAVAYSLLADPPTSLFTFLDQLPLNEGKRILPLCRAYLKQESGLLLEWIQEYVEGYPNRMQIRLAF